MQVIGAGPAGMGLVLALCNRIAAAEGKAVQEQHMLDALQIFEASGSPGGRMGHYRVNANTSAHDVVQGIKDDTPFVSVRDGYLRHPQTRSELIPLSQIQTLMVEPLVQVMREFLGERLHCGVDIARIEINENGIASYDRENHLMALSASILFCCGAIETPLPELSPLQDRWEGSMQFLMRDKLDGLHDTNDPIVIVGASHSAFSCAWRLLFDPLFDEFARDRDIVILQRRERIKLRCSTDFASEHQIDYDPEIDVCPRTGLVFFHGGLRKDAKFLYLKIRDGQENRVRIQQMNQLDERQDLLDQAGLILQATGFVANLPSIHKQGRPIRVGNPTRSGELRNLDDGEIIAGLFGMGLGLNILPAGDSRGEQSFSGGIHGFQSYPLVIAPRIIDNIAANMLTEVSN
ncbi:MAG: hypothetical protein KJN95_02025 [Gammaproteobacteria bacterium]|nr:hypothetical protein [Gammaproteobacteria bacterium]MBT8436032.1 hypothetical protein [Gammaproteobacteria bacterium]